MNVDTIRVRARKAIAPLTSTNEKTIALKRLLLFQARRTEAGQRLPPYYLVYFLLVDLLHFKNLGRVEKVAWSVPVDLEGKTFLIEHRKFGVGVFAADLPADEDAATEIVRLIEKGVKAARSYFDQRAADAVAGSNISVVNKSSELFDRYHYFLGLYKKKYGEAEHQKDEHKTHRASTVGQEAISKYLEHSYSVFALREEANWLALSTIECFFSWTEHVFIHLEILSGTCVTGTAVSTLAKARWSKKYKAALGLNDPASKQFYDKLVSIRSQTRNDITHGSFGKHGEAFSFHSSVGAVPVRLSARAGDFDFRFGHGIDFVEPEAIALVEKFIDHLWSGPRALAKIYIQESNLPLILSRVAQGDYNKAMASESEMIEFVAHLNAEIDLAANMDW